ncbi:MAG TPA: hypothetical protein VMU88_00055 [bacterium]|nr:hypothetical protein [bacterium]
MENNLAAKSRDPSLEEDRSHSIRLALDDYDDIFSDFDPQPYAERMLSDDFLYELKRAALDKEEGGLALTLLMPREKRNAAQEKVILERLKGHFRRRHRRLEDRAKADKRAGLRMAALGLIFMGLAAWLLSLAERTLWVSLSLVLLEPAGWFIFWEGGELLLSQAREINPDLVFYRKLSGARILFMPAPSNPLGPA